MRAKIIGGKYCGIINMIKKSNKLEISVYKIEIKLEATLTTFTHVYRQGYNLKKPGVALGDSLITLN